MTIDSFLPAFFAGISAQKYVIYVFVAGESIEFFAKNRILPFLFNKGPSII